MCQSNKCSDIRCVLMTTQSENGHLMVALHNLNVRRICSSIQANGRTFDDRMAKFHSKILLRMMLWNGQIFFLWPRGWRKMVFIFIFANNIKYLHSYIFWNVEEIFFFYSLNWLLAAIMVNLKINSNLPLCIIVKGNGRWNYSKMQSRHKIKAENTQCF